MYSGCYHTEWKCHSEHDDESSEDVILNGNVILNEVKNLIHIIKLDNTMKKTLTIISAIFSLSALAWLPTACVQMPEVIEEMQLDRCLTPTNLSRTPAGESVTFTWTTSKGSTAYILEVYSDPEDPDGTATQYTVAPDKIPYTVPDLDPDLTLYARVRGVSETIGDSNWAEFSSFQTYAIRPNVADLKVGTRTSGSVQLTWSTAGEDGQDLDVNAIRVALASDPEPDAEGHYRTVEVDGDAAAAGSVTVDGLEPFEKYVFTVHYGFTPRGSVSAYTLPDFDSPVAVSNSEELVVALNTKPEEGTVPVITLAYSDTPYDLGYSNGEEADPQISLNDLDHPFQLYGYEKDGEPGAFPTVYGNFTITTGCTSLILENLAFDGENWSTEALVSFKDASSVDMESMTIRNCTVTSMKRSLVYSSDKVTVVNIDNFTVDDIVFADAAGDGGEVVGFRQIGELGTVSITNSTFTNGSRELMRINVESTIAKLVISNNTFNNLCTNPSSRGLFYEMPQPGSFELSRNLFLNFADAYYNSNGTVWGSNSTKLTPKPGDVSSNFFYNIGDNFFEKEGTTDGRGSNFTEVVATSNGGAVLAEDPCAESVAGDLHILDGTVMAANAGDPRWLVEGYVKPEEDLTLEVIEPTYTWDFTDGSVFYNTADKNMVRGGIRFYVTSNPVEFDTDNGRLYFTSAGQMGLAEPVDCAIGFKVDKPGSVVISTTPDGAYPEAHATISLDGKHVGAVPVDAVEYQVSLADIEEGEEHTVYIYGCDPFYITYLQWSDYIGGGDTKLPAPEPVISAASASVTSSDPVTLSWEAVPNAGSYDIMNGEDLVANVTEPSYEIVPSAVGAGIYNYTVIAKPASDDSIREQSDPSVTVTFEVLEVLTAVSATETTTWGSSDFEWMLVNQANGVTGSEVSVPWDTYVHNNLLYKPGLRLGGSVGSTCYYQFHGSSISSGEVSRRYLSFIAGGPGKLTVIIRNPSEPNPLEPRHLLIMTGGSAPAGGTTHSTEYEASSKDNDVVAEWTLNDAVSGEYITIYADAGIRLYSITWEPGMHAAEGQLATPEVTVDDVIEGTESVTASWGAVDGATSYEVTVDGGTPQTVTGGLTSFDIQLSGLALGEHTVSVVAKADGKTDSYAGTDTFNIVAEGGLVPVSSTEPTSWGATDFATLMTQYGNGVNITEDFVYNNLKFLMGGGKGKFGENNNASGVKQARYQFGGGGSTEKQCLQFIVPGPGTLAVEYESSSTDVRQLGVSVDDAEQVFDAPADPIVKGIPLDNAAAGSVISIYSKDKGINIFSITWTPAD